MRFTSASPPPAPANAAVSNNDSRGDQKIVFDVCKRVANVHGDIREIVDAEVRRLAPLHTAAQQADIAEQAVARLNGLGELDRFLHDPQIDEVMVNAGREIWIERAGILEHVGSLTTDRVDLLIERVLAPIGRRVDRSSPIVDARLPDGARVCAVLPPVAVEGPTLCIRRFANDVRRLTEFTNDAGGAVCRAVLGHRCNIVVSGATSSGKTSLVAALLASIPTAERLVIVEDTAELPVTAAHTVRLEARQQMVDGPPPVDLAQLVRTSLRLRPDRIVVGEVRGDEVLALVQAMNTGHDGSISTCHANGPLDALLRLESLVLQAAPTWPLAAIRHQLARSVDVIIHVERGANGRARRITEISEVVATVPELTANGNSGTPTLHTLATSKTGSLTQVAELTRGRR